MGPGYEHMPGCQEYEWDSGSLFETEPVRNRKSIFSGNSNIFSVAALCLVSDDLVRFAQTIPAIAAVIADATAYSGGDQDFLVLGMSADLVAGFRDLSGNIRARYVR
jgi:hypothetical protein